MTKYEYRSLIEELNSIEEEDKRKQKEKFNSELHRDVLREVGFSNDQAVAIIGVAIDVARISTGLDPNVCAKDMMRQLGISTFSD